MVGEAKKVEQRLCLIDGDKIHAVLHQISLGWPDARCDM